MKRGFTLVEILTTIAIFSILVTITGYVYSSALARSHDNQRLSNLQTISNALEQFYLDHHQYPNIGESANTLYLAKFQLEQYPECTLTNTVSKNGYLVPTYLPSVPEDPQHPFVLSGSGADCSAEGGQGSQYLYVPAVTQKTDPPRDYILMAKMERTSNMSLAAPTIPAAYAADLNSSSFHFCTKDTDAASCTQNYYLTPKDLAH